MFISWLFFASLISVSVSATVSFQGNAYLRFDAGKEVNTQGGLKYPDDLITRNYLETYLTTELLFTKIPVGKRLRLGLRMLELDASDYDLQYTSLENARRLDDRLYAQWKAGKWDVWAGDVTDTFGKGLALSLYENRDLYFDSNLRGGKVNFRSKTLRVKAVYGRSRDWYDVEEEALEGVNLEVRPVKRFVIGGHLVHQEGISYEKRLMPGVYSGLKIGPVNLYGEYAQRRPDDGDVSVGDGTYLSAEASMLGLAVQLGYKYYHFGIENPFQTPPVVEREILTHLMTEHPHIPRMDDQVGFEIDISATPVDELFLDLNFNRSSRHDGGSLLPSLTQQYAPYWSLFLESEIYPNEDLTLKFSGGQNEEAYPTFWQKKTGIASEGIYDLNDRWSVTLAAENMWVNDKANAEKHSDQYAAFTVSRASLGSINLSYEQTSQAIGIENDHWLSIELAVDVKSNHRLMLFYGTERGGLKCTSGVCRTVQSFEGFRLTYSGRF